MSEDSIAHRASVHLHEQADRPFGDVELASGRTLAPFSRAGLTAADNLLSKADRALGEGDLTRASRLIDRAVGLSYDRHEQTAPAAFAAGMLLFNTVTDTLERCAEGDSRWLDAAVVALSSADGWGQSEMRHVLLAIRQDYVLERCERHTIRDVVATVPEQTELRDATLTSADLVAPVTSVLRVLQAYRTALDSIAE